MMAKTSTSLTLWHKWLVPQSNSCLTCGQQISTYIRGYPELCSSCYNSIPWILHPRCPICGRHVGCPDCTRQGQPARNFLINRSAVAYNEDMREWLAQYKYRGNEGYSVLMARMMGRAMKSMLHELALLNRTRRFHFDLITFVPISLNRLMERGFNQAKSMAYGAASLGDSPIIELLERSQHTEKQSFKNRGERLQNMQGAFKLVSNATERLVNVLNTAGHRRRIGFPAHKSIFSDHRPLRILLIDDVYTTGSTIDACSSVLFDLCINLEREAEIYSLTWARS